MTLPARRIRYAVVLALFLSANCEIRADEGDIVAVCRRYLDGTADEQRELAPRIRAYRGDIDEVIGELARPAAVERRDVSGVVANQKFTCPELKPVYPDDMLHYFVPADYTPSKPFGLLIFMHGGGRTTPREHPRHVVTHPDDDPRSIGLQPYFESAPFIIVAPSAPWNEKTGARWNVPDADDYISAVIQECRYRFNVDTDRVFLGGYSMGGFGAWHLCQRLSDRLAGGFVFSGAWKTERWQAWTGLPLFIRHGAHDAAAPGADGKGGRPRFTDVFYARTAHRRLTELGIPHVYVEDDGNHAIRDATDAMQTMARWILEPRRDPFARHVVAVSPRGWNASSDTPTPHNRWISIQEIADGTIDFDSVQLTGPRPSFNETREDFHNQSFRLETRPASAGMVDALVADDNRIVIRTENVRRFSVWLHPSMIDVSKPVHITVNGRDSEHGVTPRLLDAVRSYQRRKDWKLIYHAEIQLTGNSE